MGKIYHPVIDFLESSYNINTTLNVKLHHHSNAGKEGIGTTALGSGPSRFLILFIFNIQFYMLLLKTKNTSLNPR